MISYTYLVSDGDASQIEEILGLMERLADFELPPRRGPEELWRGDAEILRQWAIGDLPAAVVKVALKGKTVVGVAFAQLRPEALSQKPGAHLEVLAVSLDAEGRGVARNLVEAVESAVIARGAQSMTLNVFINNTRARGLYRHLGYDEEMLRCIKDF